MSVWPWVSVVTQVGREVNVHQSFFLLFVYSAFIIIFLYFSCWFLSVSYFMFISVFVILLFQLLHSFLNKLGILQDKMNFMYNFPTWQQHALLWGWKKCTNLINCTHHLQHLTISSTAPVMIFSIPSLSLVPQVTVQMLSSCAN